MRRTAQTGLLVGFIVVLAAVVGIVMRRVRCTEEMVPVVREAPEPVATPIKDPPVAMRDVSVEPVVMADEEPVAGVSDESEGTNVMNLLYWEARRLGLDEDEEFKEELIGDMRLLEMIT